MGPARSNIEYNLDAGPEAYTNSSVHTRLTSYTEAARLVHGLSYDLRTEERLDPEIVMRVVQGKKHGHLWLGDDILDTGSTLPLNRLRAASTSSSVPISQRPTAVATL
jgi:hypoxanthine-guanine phosphoribosyltransferase